MMISSIHLASLSPRRLELLRQIGVDPNVVRVEVDESPIRGEAPAKYVIRVAIAKALAGWAVTSNNSNLPVLAADTAVVIGDRILGKPQNREEGLEMLQMLSGKSHKVLTGVALTQGHTVSLLSTSHVTFRCIDPAEAESYWHTGEPADKAGGYGIQGAAALFISHLEGSFSGVMGLPLYETGELLENAGISLFSNTNHSRIVADE